VIEPEVIKRKIAQAMPGSMVEVEDLTGGKDHFKVIVVSAFFEGKGVMGQHQLIYDALKEEMKGPIHALTLKTYTPAQWNNQASQ
jgi:stress-induced morphogen